MYQRVPGVDQDLAQPDVSCHEDMNELCATATAQALPIQTGNTLASVCAIREGNTSVRSLHASDLNLDRSFLLLKRDDPPLETIQMHAAYVLVAPRVPGGPLCSRVRSQAHDLLVQPLYYHTRYGNCNLE